MKELNVSFLLFVNTELAYANLTTHSLKAKKPEKFLLDGVLYNCHEPMAYVFMNGSFEPLI